VGGLAFRGAGSIGSLWVAASPIVARRRPHAAAIRGTVVESQTGYPIARATVRRITDTYVTIIDVHGQYLSWRCVLVSASAGTFKTGIGR